MVMGHPIQPGSDGSNPQTPPPAFLLANGPNSPPLPRLQHPPPLLVGGLGRQSSFQGLGPPSAPPSEGQPSHMDFDPNTISWGRESSFVADSPGSLQDGLNGQQAFVIGPVVGGGQGTGEDSLVLAGVPLAVCQTPAGGQPGAVQMPLQKEHSSKRTSIVVFGLGFLFFPIWLIGWRWVGSKDKSTRILGRVSAGLGTFLSVGFFLLVAATFGRMSDVPNICSEGIQPFQARDCLRRKSSRLEKCSYCSDGKCLREDENLGKCSANRFHSLVVLCGWIETQVDSEVLCGSTQGCLWKNGTCEHRF